MYLTRFHVDARTRAGARYLDNPHRLHAAIYASMPTQPVEVADEHRPLWRVDRDHPWSPVLWVVSKERPDLDRLADEAGRSVNGQVYESRDYAPFLSRLAKGQAYAFRFAGNPVRSGHAAPQSVRTQRFGHVTALQQTRWFEARGRSHGFTIRTSTAGAPDVAVAGRRRTVFWRGERRVVISVAEFIGHLEVVDPVRLSRALSKGIGHARAYGCGLLTLAAPR